jgi:hypothetical protein
VGNCPFIMYLEEDNGMLTTYPLMK